MMPQRNQEKDSNSGVNLVCNLGVVDPGKKKLISTGKFYKNFNFSQAILQKNIEFSRQISLPSEIRSLPQDLSSSFYKLLKTFIFDRAWAGSASE